jgi:hypothetical protein
MNLNADGLSWLADNGKLTYQVTPGRDNYSSVLVLDWQPGDATRYQMVFTRLPQDQDAVPQTHWMVTDVNIGRGSMFLNGGNCVDKFYVHEKLSQGNAPVEWFRAQTIIINALLGDFNYAKAVYKGLRDEYPR